jgi:hypothetical protein
MDTSFSLNAPSIEDAQQSLCESVRDGKLASERVYQICPSIDNPEPVRAVAICHEAIGRPVTLSATLGMYSVFRCISFAEAHNHQQNSNALSSSTLPA